MKLTDYVSMIESEEDPAMRQKKIHTETALDGSVGLWNHKRDQWSRNAKHHLSKNDLANAESIAVAADIVEEGLLGGIQGLAPINRIMQLAGLQSGSVVESDDQPLAEDTASMANLMNQEYNKTASSADYRDKKDLAVLATMSSVLEAMNVLISKLPSTMPDGISDEMVTTIKNLPAIGIAINKALSTTPVKE